MTGVPWGMVGAGVMTVPRHSDVCVRFRAKGAQLTWAQCEAGKGSQSCDVSTYSDTRPCRHLFAKPGFGNIVGKVILGQLRVEVVAAGLSRIEWGLRPHSSHGFLTGPTDSHPAPSTL